MNLPSKRGRIRRLSKLISVILESTGRPSDDSADNILISIRFSLFLVWSVRLNWIYTWSSYKANSTPYSLSLGLCPRVLRMNDFNKILWIRWSITSCPHVCQLFCIDEKLVRLAKPSQRAWKFCSKVTTTSHRAVREKSRRSRCSSVDRGAYTWRTARKIKKRSVINRSRSSCEISVSKSKRCVCAQSWYWWKTSASCQDGN